MKKRRQMSNDVRWLLSASLGASAVTVAVWSIEEFFHKDVPSHVSAAITVIVSSGVWKLLS